ncbi:uncharacterized protein LOC126765343 [Bactrocera neohumeralis]|uniref:uncharacterized protein LOC126765343 n=1 Tax=Bactrocera neohumeralis TaxID=98809 RepID=UPI00216575AB|nr:uncharacterized protein LOC126765343 [Bactrocera neohumeralis]
MESNTEIQKVVHKRVRKAPYRKWTDNENESLINFLRDNSPLEKPTAQHYYKRFLNRTGSDLHWTLVRCKVKNLRLQYTKAKSWQNTTGNGTMDNCDTTKNAIVRMCVRYDDLEDIFGYRELTSNCLVLDTEYIACTGSPEVATSSDIIVEEIVALPEPLVTPSTSKAVRKGIYSRTALSDVLDVHSSLFDAKKDRIEKELKMRENELMLKEQQLLFDKEKFEK